MGPWAGGPGARGAGGGRPREIPLAHGVDHKREPGVVMQAAVGLRVVRGPDWRRGLEDGGEGGVGTVVFLGTRREYRAWRERPPPALGLLAGIMSTPSNLPCHTRGYVVVQWDIGGYRREYKCGGEATYELRVLDSSPAGRCGHFGLSMRVCDHGSKLSMLIRRQVVLQQLHSREAVHMQYCNRSN